MREKIKIAEFMEEMQRGLQERNLGEKPRGENPLDFYISFHLGIHNKNQVLFFIYDQNEKLRRLRFTAENGMTIAASSVPEMGEGIVYIRGEDREDDYRICVKMFPSTNSAKSYVESVLAAFRDLKAKYSGQTPGMIISERDNYTF